MKSRLNYKNRKTIIMTASIIALLALSVTGMYVFTKGNNSAEAFTEGNTIVDGSSQIDIEQTKTETIENLNVELNEDLENEVEEIENTINSGIESREQQTTGTTISTTAGNVPNQEYVTERQEEVERLIYESFLVGWTPISLVALTDDIDLNKVEPKPSYTIEKVATLVNGITLEKDENGKVTTKVQNGDKVTYIITLENTGNVTLQNIDVIDELIGYKGVIPVLAIGDKEEITVEYTVDEKDMNEDEEIINIVKATVIDPTNPDKKLEEEDDEIVPVNPFIQVKGTKTWIDGNKIHDNANEIVLRLYRKTVKEESIEEKVDTTPIWNENVYTFNDLEKYNEKGYVYEYRVEEAKVNEYTTKQDGNNFTNTIIDPLNVIVSGTKTWRDGNKTHNNAKEIILTLYRKSAKEGSIEEVVNKPPVWNENTYTYRRLDNYDKEGYVYTYRVEETPISGYTSIQNGNNFINTIVQEYTEITVSKVWNDASNQDGIRPVSVKVQLFADGIAQGNVITLTEANKLQTNANIWQHKFVQLNKYDLTDGHTINYEVKEVISSGNVIENNGTNGGYTVTYKKDAENKVMTITNSYTPKTTNIIATKVWVDNNNEYKHRPSSVTIKLYNGNNVVNVEPVISKQGNRWTYTFNNLPMYSAGKLITYTAKELRADGTIVGNNTEYNENYLTTYSGNTITNTLIITVSGTKSWDNKNSPVDIKPGSITVEVLNGSTVVDTIPVTSANGWKYTSKKLPKYNSNNVAIEYTVREQTVSGYTPDYSNRTVLANGNIIANIKNTLQPFTQYTANVEEISMTTINKNVYIVLDASSSMNSTITGTTDIKMEVACDQVASLIRRVFASSKGSTVKLITFNKDTTVNKNRVLGVFVYGTATNATQGEALAKEIEAVTEAPWTSKWGKTKTYGTDMYSALTKLNSEITNDDNDGTITAAEKGKNVVIFVGDGSPTSPDDNSSYPGNKIDENKISDPNADCPIYNTARSIKAKVSKFYTLGFDLNLSGESYSSDQAKQIIKNIGKEYYDVKNINEFTNAFDSIFKGMNTNRFTRTTQTYSPIITIVANGNVKIGDGITLISANKGKKEFYTQKQIDDTDGITYTPSTRTFTINTRVFTGNISFKYTIE